MMVWEGKKVPGIPEEQPVPTSCLCKGVNSTLTLLSDFFQLHGDRESFSQKRDKAIQRGSQSPVAVPQDVAQKGFSIIMRVEAVDAGIATREAEIEIAAGRQLILA